MTRAIKLLRGDWIIEQAGKMFGFEEASYEPCYVDQNADVVLPAVARDAGYAARGWPFLAGLAEEQRRTRGLPVRQLLEQRAPEAFHPPARAAALWRKSQGWARSSNRCGNRYGYKEAGPYGLWLHAVSYCWISWQHSDPHGFHLRRLARILRKLRELRATYACAPSPSTA